MSLYKVGPEKGEKRLGLRTKWLVQWEGGGSVALDFPFFFLGEPFSLNLKIIMG